MRIRSTIVLGILIFLLSSCSHLYRLLNYSPSKKIKNIEFDEKAVNEGYQFYYPDTINNKYLKKLRIDYNLDLLIKDKTREFDKITTILNWTNKQWEHNGNNKPSKSDPITILEEAKKGSNFRCVEYGIILSAALNSIGISTRIIGLKTFDVEKVKYGAGHVASECYSKEYNKWIFIDGQFNVIPKLNEIPLNAVEFKKAIIENTDDLKIVNLNGELSKKDKSRYIEWISKYLYYFDIKFDNRINPDNDQINIRKKSSLMLVPINEKEPKIFQKKYKIDYCLYTNNINDFYQIPK
jgi:hypothetical protein